jgi:zinc and cadmium transporter
MSPFASSLVATLAVSLIAFAGIVVLFARTTERLQAVLLSFAAGVLLATTFLEVLPEAIEHADGEGGVLVAALGAMIAFFFLERLLHGFHGHEHGHGHLEDIHVETAPYFVLLGDGLHNFIDGIVIAASFAASPELGIATTLAVAVHEVPAEIADFGVLVAGGFSRGVALALNVASGLTAVVGTVVFFTVSAGSEATVPWLMAAAGGMFIYIAGSDLIPQLHHQRSELNGWVYVPFVAGVALIAALGLLE